MRVIKRNGSEARTALLRMVCDTSVVGPIAARWDGELFGSSSENLIAGWAVRHYEKYGRAPGRDISAYFDRWSNKHSEESVIEFVGEFLESLSHEHRKNGQSISSAIALEMANNTFHKVRLEKLKDHISTAVEKGDIEKALSAVSEFRGCEVSDSEEYYEPFRGGGLIRDAMRSVGKSLITFPQEAMNRFFAGALFREEFITFTGPDKSGKSFWLQEMVYQGCLSGNRVAFFEVGDQSRDQILRRLIARAAGRPFKADRSFKYPTKLEYDDPPHVEHEMRCCEKKMTGNEASRSMRQFARDELGGNKSRLRLSVHPNTSINILGIEGILKQWRRDGWNADIIVIDYADLLAPMHGNVESRDSINATWKAMRGLSQKMRSLLITATQSDADAYEATLITKGNFSEDKRKNAHVTGAVAINQTGTEKTKGIVRLNWTLARDLEFSETTCLYCAPCLAIANPCVHSCFA